MSVGLMARRVGPGQLNLLEAQPEGFRADVGRQVRFQYPKGNPATPVFWDFGDDLAAAQIAVEYAFASAFSRAEIDCGIRVVRLWDTYQPPYRHHLVLPVNTEHAEPLPDPDQEYERMSPIVAVANAALAYVRLDWELQW